MPSTRSYTVDVSFDTPVAHPFSYLVPEGTTVAPGQRVVAPLGNAERVGVVVGLHEGVTPGLKPFIRVLDAAPLVAPLLTWTVIFPPATVLASVRR